LSRSRIRIIWWSRSRNAMWLRLRRKSARGTERQRENIRKRNELTNRDIETNGVNKLDKLLEKKGIDIRPQGENRATK
jgi:hypothetical protein